MFIKLILVMTLSKALEEGQEISLGSSHLGKLHHKSPASVPVCPRSVVSAPSISPKIGLIENKYISSALSPVTWYDVEAANKSSWERSEAVKKEEIQNNCHV